MSYPVLDLTSARARRDALVGELDSGRTVADIQDDSRAALADLVREQMGPSVELDQIWSASDARFAVWQSERQKNGPASRADREVLEAEMASVVHESLSGVAVEVLGDLDFWRYLALGPFVWFLLEREPELQDQDYGGIDAKRGYWLLIRTYLWGLMAFDAAEEDQYRRATIVGLTRKSELGSRGREIDFWHSHMVRKRWNLAPGSAKSFVDEVVTKPVALDVSQDERHSNELSKRVRRLGHTVEFLALEEGELSSLFHEQKLRTLGLDGVGSSTGEG